MKKTVMIKKNYEFKSVFKKGKCYKGTMINIFVKNNKKNINMLGIAISKKAGNSVKRNKIKRLIRENYKNIEQYLKTGNEIIVLWKKNAEFNSFDFYAIKSEMEESFKNLNLIQGDI